VAKNPQNPNLNQIQGPKNFGQISPKGYPLRILGFWAKIFRSGVRAQIWVLGVFEDADSESVFRLALSGLEVDLWRSKN
jgi:hypothetical protein